jgi:hypothetical protein
MLEQVTLVLKEEHLVLEPLLLLMVELVVLTILITEVAVEMGVLAEAEVEVEVEEPLIKTEAQVEQVALLD